MDALQEALTVLLDGGTLSSELAAATMGAVMRGEASDAQFGAVFALLRARGETVEELLGFARTMRACVVPATAPTGAIDTCGTGGDGADTFNVSTCAALVAAGAGAVVAKHGNRAVSSRCGSADVLEVVGGRLEQSPAEVAASLDASGFAFMFAPAFHPSMRHAEGPRRALRTRTAFNLLGPLTNPAGVTRQVLGVSDPVAAPRLARVLQRLGCERALVVHGVDGLDELSIAAPSIVYDVTPAEIRRTRVTPGQLGLTCADIAAIAGGDAAENARLLRAVLDGSEAGARRDVVLLNAAAATLVAGIAGSLREGVELAARSIDDGAALDVLERWINAGAEVAA